MANKFIKISELFSLIVGFSSVIMLLILLFINDFTPLTNFIPENNIFIKTTEILIGLFSLIFMSELIFKKIIKF